MCHRIELKSLTNRAPTVWTTAFDRQSVWTCLSITNFFRVSKLSSTYHQNIKRICNISTFSNRLITMHNICFVVCIQLIKKLNKSLKRCTHFKFRPAIECKEWIVLIFTNAWMIKHMSAFACVCVCVCVCLRSGWRRDGFDFLLLKK